MTGPAGRGGPCEVGYLLEGRTDRPVLVLANSVGTTAALWEPQLPRLLEQFCVLRVEHRGHGGAPVPRGPYRIADLGGDLLALLDRLGLRRVSFAGISLGGMVGMWLAANSPERVDRLALVCTSAYLPPAEGWLARAARVRRGGTAAVADTVVPRWFTPDFARRQPDIVARAAGMLAGIPAEGYAGCCEAIADLDLRPVLGRIVAPTLVIAGEQDLPTPPEHGRTIAEAIPDARLVVLPGAAHLANLEQPQQVSDLLLGHLLDDRSEGPRGGVGAGG